MTPATFLIINIFLISAMSSAMPWLTRRDLFFSVTVPTSFRSTDAGRRILQKYVLFGWVGTAVLAGLTFAFTTGETVIRVGIAGVLAVWMGSFLISRHDALQFAVSPHPIRSAVLAVRRDGLPGGIIGATVPFLFLVAKGIEFYARWENIPARFPVHWGLNGPDSWVDRMPITVFGSLLVVALACAAMMWTAWAILHASRQVDRTGDNANSEQRFRRTGVAGLMALAYAFALTLPPMPNMYLTVPYAPVLILGTSIAVAASLAMSGQGGTRLPGYRPVLGDTAPAGDGTSDSHWKLGILYFNRSDPALLVEKRFGLGWTLNFGHPVCWVIVIALLGWPLLKAIAS